MLAQVLLVTPVFANKAKLEKARPQTKTLPKTLAARPAPGRLEAERKTKKGLAAKPEPAPLSKKAGKLGLNAATSKLREQEAKLKPQLRGARAKAETPLLAKAVNKSSGKLATALKPNRLAEQPLTSRLTRATFTPIAPAKLQTETERHGKFGKQVNDPLPATRRRTTRAEETNTATVTPNHRTEKNNLRESEPERPAGRNTEPSETASARRPREANTATDTPAYQIQLPDKIEVVEYGSLSPSVAKLLTLPEARPLTPFGALVSKTNTPPAKRNDLVIPQERVLEIQYELVKRGFYKAEPNGVYDEATILAMWEFQKDYGLPATGYPSAHALKRLGLTSW
ncbi:MAG: peptidoglycan-binding protein [Acidobacteria bacterium]|nr:peptidoglycan-binding protein [Acidobacteriota bacterium]MBI3427882.1 peptidoglycan-binding protein [Acidobacteriota bacterium]